MAGLPVDAADGILSYRSNNADSENCCGQSRLTAVHSSVRFTADRLSNSTMSRAIARTGCLRSL